MVSFGSNKQSSAPGSVWKPQQPFLRDLYSAAQGLYGQQGFIGEASQGLSQGLMQGAGGFLNNATNPAIGNLMQRASGQNPYIDQQVAGLGADIGQFAQRYLGDIGRSAGLSGGYGGGRMQVAQGMVGQDALRQFQQGATALRSGAYDSGTQAALGAGALGAQGIGNLGNIYNLGMSPFTASWMPLQNYAQIVGGPTVLGGGSSGGGFNFGFL